MTTALYRRYRPDTFQDVIGQDHVTAPLMAALRGDRVTHAYLFSGPRGCGKTTSARILARCLNCERFPTDTPCGQCPSCRDLATGGPGSLDVVEIDAASHNGVDDARDLRERASFAPARDRFKIFILDEAHMVTPQGFNALLKLVEEPPAHVKFVFATTEPEKVIGTIRSRTHHYPFRLVAPDTLEGYLAHLCDAEGVSVGPGVFPLVTRAGGGSVRDTLSVMDQLIGGAVDGEVDYARAVALLGYTDTTMLDACIDALAASDGAGVFRVVDRVVSSGHDPRRFVEDLLQRLRDLLVIALAGPEAGPALGSLPDDELARMEVQSRTIGAAGLSRAADTTAQALSQMVGATSPRLQLELLMARLLVPGRRATVPDGQAAPAQRPGAGAGVGGTGAEAGAGVGGRAMAADVVRRAASPVPPGGPSTQGAPPAGPPSPPSSAGEPAAPASAASGARAPAASSAPAPSPTPQGGVAPVDWDAPVQAPGRPPRRPAQVGPAEGSGLAGGQAGPAAGPPPGPDAAPQRREQGDSAADAEMIRGRWEEVLEAAKRSRRATWALVSPNSQPGGIRNGVFEVIFSGQGLVNAFENGGHGPVLSQALHQALGLRLEVHAVLAGPGGHPGPGGPGGGRPAGPGGRLAPDGPGGGWPAPDGPRGGRPAGPGPAAPGGDAGGPAVDDGWGVIAVPGGSGPAPAGPPQTGPAGSEHVVPPPAARSAPATGSAQSASPGSAPPGPGPSDSAGSAPAAPSAAPPTATEPMASPASAASAVSVASPSGTASPPAPDPVDESPIATVHRLHALPTLPGGAAPSSPSPSPSPSPLPSPSAPAPAEPAGPAGPADQHRQSQQGHGHDGHGGQPEQRGQHDQRGQHGLAPVSWEGPATFSDGTPVPQEPPPEDGDEEPDDSWAPAAGDRVSAARAAARAAARGRAPSSPSPAHGAAFSPSSVEDDVPSADDEDAEEAGVVGLEVVKRLLGATVLEEITVTQEGR